MLLNLAKCIDDYISDADLSVSIEEFEDLTTEYVYSQFSSYITSLPKENILEGFDIDLNDLYIRNQIPENYTTQEYVDHVAFEEYFKRIKLPQLIHDKVYDLYYKSSKTYMIVVPLMACSQTEADQFAQTLFTEEVFYEIKESN